MSPGARTAAVALATAAAFWPVWRWYALRVADGADEKWGLLALLLAAAIALARRRGRPTSSPSLAGLAAAVALFAASYHLLPPMLRAVPALAAVALLVSAAAHGRRLHAGSAALLLLALPLEATLQFYAGYPMRVVATQVAGTILRAGGVPVAASGALLVWRGDAIGVDAPCSGIQMLWVGLFVAAGLAAWRDLGALRTVSSALAAAGLVVIGNGVRVAALFVKEAHVLTLPGWTHEAIGLALFAGLVLVLLAVLDRLAPSASARPGGGPWTGPRPLPLAAYAALCAASAAVPLLSTAPGTARDAAFGGWPADLDGVALHELPLSEGDERFARGFPGRMARFTDGRRGILLRWLPRPSRQLHPAADCFRGSGYAIEPRPARRDAHGRRWSCFEARRGAETMEVCERIFDEGGRSWTDASSWWWAAALGRARGPYWAVTVVEPSLR